MAPVTNQFSKHKWWILTVLITLPVAAIAADVPNMFTAGTVISSDQVNANFKNLSDRVTALEGAPKTTVQTPLQNSIGPLPAAGKTAPFTSAGGPLLIIVSGTAYGSMTLDIAVQLDGVTIGHLMGYTNETGSHKALPTRALSVTNAAAGNHTIGLIAVSATTDQNDYFSVTVVETP